MMSRMMMMLEVKMIMMLSVVRMMMMMMILMVIMTLMVSVIQASTLTQNGTGHVGPVTRRIYWSC